MAGSMHSTPLVRVCAILLYMSEGVKQKNEHGLEFAEVEAPAEEAQAARVQWGATLALDGVCQSAGAPALGGVCAKYAAGAGDLCGPGPGKVAVAAATAAGDLCGPGADEGAPRAEYGRNETGAASQGRGASSVDRRALRALFGYFTALLAFGGLIWNLAKELFHLSTAASMLSVQLAAEKRLRPDEAQATAEKVASMLSVQLAAEKRLRPSEPQATAAQPAE